jgi:hypothetical protein
MPECLTILTILFSISSHFLDVVEGSIDASWFIVHPENLTKFWPEVEVSIECGFDVDYTVEVNGKGWSTMADQSTAFNITDTSVVNIWVRLECHDHSNIVHLVMELIILMNFAICCVDWG